MSNDAHDDQTDEQEPEQQEPEEQEPEEPAAQHVNRHDELQDPDGELGSLKPDSASLNTFNPPRFN